jgi:hypothetical protein
MRCCQTGETVSVTKRARRDIAESMSIVGIVNNPTAWPKADSFGQAIDRLMINEEMKSWTRKPKGVKRREARAH